MRCPYLSPPTDRQHHRDEIVPGTCRDPVSGLSRAPGFWEYWNRCTSLKHLRCPRYRRHQQTRTTGSVEAQYPLRRSA